jgi:hypothetical protein
MILTCLTLSFGDFKDDTLIIRHILDANGYTSTPVSECTNGATDEINYLKLSGISVLSDSIWNLESLLTLRIENSNIHFNHNVKNLKELGVMELYHDTLSENLLEIGTLKKLSELVMENCNLTRIPDTIFSLGQLLKLDLSLNKLTNIPEAIGNLIAVKEIKLNDNQLLEIPNTISALSNLTGIDISNNLLTTLPEGIAENKKFLSNLNAMNNQLTSLPENIVTLDLKTYSIVANNCINLPISRPCPEKTYWFYTFQIAGNKLCALSDTVKNWLLARNPNYMSSQSCPNTIAKNDIRSTKSLAILKKNKKYLITGVTQSDKNITVQFFSLNGKEYKRETYNINTDIVDMTTSVSTLPNGAYIMVLNTHKFYFDKTLFIKN